MPPGTAGTASAGESRWSLTISNNGIHHSHHRGHHSRGYYKNVWVPAVYRTHYGECGRAFRVCVREGYYKKGVRQRLIPPAALPQNPLAGPRLLPLLIAATALTAFPE